MSETGLGRRDGPSENVLPCQMIPPYNKPAVRSSLPDDMALYPENRQVEHLDMDGAGTLSKKREFAISLLRLGLAPENRFLWQGVHNACIICYCFHMSCILLKYLGKYLRGSGPDDALIECSVFGPGVLETVLNGTHFVRSLTGTLIV